MPTHVRRREILMILSFSFHNLFFITVRFMVTFPQKLIEFFIQYFSGGSVGVDATGKVSMKDFDLLKVLGTGGESRKQELFASLIHSEQY